MGLSGKICFCSGFCRISNGISSKNRSFPDTVLPRLQRNSKARARDKMLQIHWYFSIGNDLRHFRKLWKNIKTRLEKDQHRARFCLPPRTNKIDKKLSQKQPKMLPKWSLERSWGVPRPPRELQSTLLGASNKPPGATTSPPRPPK